MPYEWQKELSDGARLHLWPHRSLTQRGFVGFFAITFGLITLPALAVLGSPVLWGLLPFFLVTLAGIWYAIRRNQRDTEIIEDLVLRGDAVTLTRHGPRGRRQDWRANPHWVRVMLHRSGGPVPNYVTMKGEGREVEIGAFLSEDERIALHGELAEALTRIRQSSAH
ncbi:DUF2244 domain-containing protein [Neotabrizicola shimadae]|uniref:DUF2244 domain-containing protein n=1 Tax=Neotabrizicola shimadae TaxID=2807096 RepID=A0A8G1EAA8_9RHOB|nr:DUF2244 domain-containing protein [Neotabrizicola shimadae]QYZ68425.1 DUF2244 domain-containing protein [Neotabrizicola shimadae]